MRKFREVFHLAILVQNLADTEKFYVHQIGTTGPTLSGRTLSTSSETSWCAI